MKSYYELLLVQQVSEDKGKLIKVVMLIEAAILVLFQCVLENNTFMN